MIFLCVPVLDIFFLERIISKQFLVPVLRTKKKKIHPTSFKFLFLFLMFSEGKGNWFYKPDCLGVWAVTILKARLKPLRHRAAL